MQELLKITCIIVLAACVSLIIYLFINAINTAKKNKAKEEASRKIFMAQMAQNTKIKKTEGELNPALKQPLIEITPNKSQPLNYEQFEEYEENEVVDKSLTDFFSKT